MSEIQRYEMILTTRCGEGWQELQKEPEGDWVRFCDHEAQVAALQARLQRATDLVRYARHHLHDEKAITDAEYAALVEDSDSGKRVARLEGYDRTRRELEAQIDALRSENQRLRAPVSDDEASAAVLSCNFGSYQDAMNALIRARAEAPQEKAAT